MSVQFSFDSHWLFRESLFISPPDHCLLLTKIKEGMATTEIVYPLAFPKSISHKCEICGKTASRMCAKCRVTYYCSEEHQATDSNGIHDKICSALATIRAKQPFLPSEEERRDRDREIREKKLHLIEVTRMIGERHVIKNEKFVFCFKDLFVYRRFFKAVTMLPYQLRLLP